VCALQAKKRLSKSSPGASEDAAAAGIGEDGGDEEDGDSGDEGEDPDDQSDDADYAERVSDVDASGSV
jgi:hypothetical protein